MLRLVYNADIDRRPKKTYISKLKAYQDSCNSFSERSVREQALERISEMPFPKNS